MKVIESMPRPELLAYAAELGELSMFSHRHDLRSSRLLALLDDAELLELVKSTVAEFREALR